MANRPFKVGLVMLPHQCDFVFAFCFGVTIVAASSFGTNLAAQEEAPFQGSGFMLAALHNESALQELELVDGQKRELQEILHNLSSSRSELIEYMNEISASGLSKEEIEAERMKMKQQLNDIETDSLQQLNDVLLPHQLDRLKQSTVQVMMKHCANFEKVECGLLTSQMRKFLGIDDKQAKKIAETAKHAREEMADKIKKLKAEAHAKLLGELSAEQRKKYEKLTGDRVRNDGLLDEAR